MLYNYSATKTRLIDICGCAIGIRRLAQPIAPGWKSYHLMDPDDTIYHFREDEQVKSNDSVRSKNGKDG